MQALYRALSCKTLTVLALFGPAGAALAAPESPWLDDLPIVLSASRLPQPQSEAPGAVTVLDGDFIRENGYRDLARIFRLVPGMQVGQERASSYWVTYHGLGNNYPSEMQVLVDGRSVYSMAGFGGVDWTTLPVGLDEIERIEIVRGPNPVTFGANAFMGVINIVTRRTTGDDTNRVRALTGDAQTNDLYATTTFSTDSAGFRLSAETHHDTGFANLRDERHFQQASIRNDWQVDNFNALMLRLSASSGKLGLGYDKTIFDSGQTRDETFGTQAAQLKWTHASSASDEQTLQIYHNSERYIDGWTAFIPPGYPTGPTWINIDRNRTSTRDQLEFQSRLSGERRQSVWGFELRQDRVRAPYMFQAGDPPAINLYRLFGNLEEKLARGLSLNAGAALERYRGEPTHFAPRSFLLWQTSRTDTLRVGLTRAWQQSPTFEKYAYLQVVDPVTGTVLAQPYTPNPDLKQTRIDSVELGYLGRFPSMAATLDVRLFNDRIRNFIYRAAITTTPTPALDPWVGTQQYQNLDHPLTLRGIEYQLKLHPWTGGTILLNHAIISRHARNGDIEDRTAPYVANLNWRQQWAPHWRSVLDIYRVGEEAGGDGYAPLAPYVSHPYTSFDVRLIWQTLLSKSRKLELSLNALNLGERHQEIADRSEQAYLATLGNDRPANIASRTLYFGLSLDF